MCIAILKTKKGVITDEALRNSFKNNSNGAGIAYTVNNELIIEKGIFNEEAFVKAVRNAEKVCDNNMLIHCRISTSGKIDSRNTHPFLIKKNICLIHNGILDVDVDKNSDINDTQIFINKYLKKIRKYDLMHNKCIHKLIEEVIGTTNKFVFLDNKGYYKIINESKGEWVNDVWYSNSSYKEKTYKYTGKYYGYSMFGDVNDHYDMADYYARYYDKDYDDEDEYFDYQDYLKGKLSDKQFDAIIDNIAKLDYADFLGIGDTPMLDYSNNTIISLEEAEHKFAVDYLQDVDESLYEFYNECRDELLDYVDSFKADNEIEEDIA